MAAVVHHGPLTHIPIATSAHSRFNDSANPRQRRRFRRSISQPAAFLPYYADEFDNWLAGIPNWHE
ncbi:MAG: hypothetical protein M3443_07630, partial [Actinomycetota bacterium]|nr:hypothetical protein [Actinomycetota bacterium]